MTKIIIRLYTVLLLMMLGVTGTWGQTTYYVFKYDGHYVAHDGSSMICVENNFSVAKCLWEFTFGSEANQKYLKTYGSDHWLHYNLVENTEDTYTLLLKNTKNGWYSADPTNGIQKESGVGICYNDATPCWELVTYTEDAKKALGVEVTMTEMSYTNVSSSIGGGPDVISATGTYSYNVKATNINTLSYLTFTLDEQKFYWYENSDHDALPEDWGNVTKTSLTKIWSLTGGDGYASVDATGKLTVTSRPATDVTMTLTCTLSYNGHSLVVEKEIILAKPVVNPTVSLSDKTITIGPAESNVTYYYTTGATEPLTDTPTTSLTPYSEPFELGDGISCIKVIADHYGEVSEVKVYDVLYFSEGPTTGSGTATVAPFIYSCDLTTGLTPYIISRVTPFDHSVILTPLEYIPQGVPVLLVDATGTKKGLQIISWNPIDLEGINNDENNENDITPITDSQKAANMLHVTDKDGMAVADAQVYMYYKGEFILTFASEPEKPMKPGRFFLYNPNYQPASTTTPVTTPSTGGGDTSGARLRLVIEETTGMDEVRWKMDDGRCDDWYTLDGRRLTGQPTQKGVYLNNGYKVVIK